jgi:hypothetical protein
VDLKDLLGTQSWVNWHLKQALKDVGFASMLPQFEIPWSDSGVGRRQHIQSDHA